MNKVYSTLDVYSASWIYLSTGIYPELKNHNSKISLNFPFNEKVIKAISDYNSGEKIEAIRFSLTIKNLKAQIFQAKNNIKIS